jgi:hypothetical protein
MKIFSIKAIIYEMPSTSYEKKKKMTIKRFHYGKIQ